MRTSLENGAQGILSEYTYTEMIVDVVNIDGLPFHLTWNMTQHISIGRSFDEIGVEFGENAANASLEG